jgi:hypothetical protein
MILNLTQHAVSPEQIAAGVVEPVNKKAVQTLLTFDYLPKRLEIMERARSLANLAIGYDGAMIGGAAYLVTRLEVMLDALGIKALHAFSVRESVDTIMPDGSTKKVAVFKHKGFVGE